MKVLLDMNLSPRWVDFLARSGIEARHWSTIGRGDAPDGEIMRYAIANDLVVLTHDLDFGTILAASRGFEPSVVQLRARDVSPEASGAIVAAALAQMATSLASGALLTVDADRVRLRLLPLRPPGDADTIET